MQNLENLRDIKLWCLTGEYECRIQKCYDGDTCTVIIYYNSRYIAFNVRMFGIDTPEKNGPKHKEALISRNKLISLVTDQKIDLEYLYTKEELEDIFEKNKKILLLKCANSQDKFGRILGKIYDNNKCVNDIIIKEGFATEYNGGKKNIN